MKRTLSVILVLALLLSLTAVPALAANLSAYATVSFSKSYDVYSGPGNHYYRANAGRAMYGGGVVRVYGRVGSWLMIGYQMSNGSYRIGYISSDALNYTNNNLRGTYDDNLSFNSSVAYTMDNSPVTDDPIINCNAVCTIPKDVKVTVLGYFENNWAYCELKVNSQLMRGCIRGTHLTTTVPANGGIENATSIQTSTNVPATAVPYPTSTPGYVTNPPYYPPVVPSYTGSLNNYQKAAITAAFDVYSGPSTSYYRAANGHAMVGGGTIRVYGQQYGWLLIGYGFGNNQYRLGYINISAVNSLTPSLYSIPTLSFQSTPVTVLYDTELTDDPVCLKPVVMGIPSGTQVTYLASTYELDILWAYVELNTTQGLMRGFIPQWTLGAVGNTLQ